MAFVLQSQSSACSGASQLEVSLAFNLLQISIVGIPLLLALFQFINAHEYSVSENRIRPRTFLYGVLMVVSSFILWGLFFVALCVIRTTLGSSQLTAMLFGLLVVLLAIIFVILLIQLEQMVGESLRYPLGAYLLAAFSILIAIYYSIGGNYSNVVIYITYFVLFTLLGSVSHKIGFTEVGIQLAKTWQRFQNWREARSEDNDEKPDE